MQARPTKVPLGPNALLLLAGLVAAVAAVGWATLEIALSVTEKPMTNEALATRKPGAPQAAPPASPAPGADSTPPAVEEAPPAVAEHITAHPFPDGVEPKPIIDVAGPDGEVPATAPVPRSLNPRAATLQTIQTQMREGQPALDACYETALQRDPSLSGLWQIEVVLDPAADAGSTVSAEATGKGHSDPEFEQCMESAIERWDFGTVDRTIRVTRRVSYSAE